MPHHRPAVPSAILLALAAVLALGLAACGSDDAPEVFESDGGSPAADPGGDDGGGGDGAESGGGGSGDGGATGDSAGDGDGGDGAGDGDGGDGAGDGGGGDGAGDGGSGDGTGDGDGGGVDHDDHGPVGSLGPVLLRSSVSTAHLQVDRVEGVDLAARARDALVGALQRHGDKQVEDRGGAALPGRDVWTTGDIRSVAREHRAVDARGDVAAIQVVVLDGRHEDDSVLGIAVDATTFALFPEQMRGDVVTGVAFGSDEVQEAVTVHELGHLFGLVNLTGHGAFHEDPEHPGHSANEGSVMYWAVETDAISRVFEGGPPTTFDADDEEEMSRIRG